MTEEEREAYKLENGCYPIEDSDIPEGERLVLTTEQIALGEAVYIQTIAKKYLTDTDWYASRKAEAGIEIPSDVLALRQQARLDAADQEG